VAWGQGIITSGDTNLGTPMGTYMEEIRKLGNINRKKLKHYEE
jgi:hypothetical protein